MESSGKLLTAYRTPSIAERKRWLFSSEERLDQQHREVSIKKSPSLTRLHSSSSKVGRRLKLLRKSKKMSKKPPVPEKSDRVKNLPVPRPRNAAPSLKPLPYNNHHEAVKKPDPAPRKVNRQQKNTVATQRNNHLPGTSPPVGDVSFSPASGGLNCTPSPPRAQSGGIVPRPRLDTPVTPPDPDSAPQNGVLSPPVPLARSGAAAAVSKTRTPLSEGSSGRRPVAPRVGSKCTGKSPLPHPKDSRGCVDGSTPQELEYAVAYGVSDKVHVDDAEENLYSTVSDGPRRFITPPPSETPPTSVVHSLPPPVPLPRSSVPTPSVTHLPITGTPHSEYNITTHVNKKSEVSGKPAPLLPTPPDTYSVLARPDQPNKPLYPVPHDNSSQMYSSLDKEGIQQPAPLVKPTNQDERYSHLEFNGVAGHDVVAEHYEMSAEFRGGSGNDSVRNKLQGSTPDGMGIYEVVSPQDEDFPTPPVEHTHRPLSYTRSAPLDTTPQREKPKAAARRSSQKSMESLELSSHDQGSVGHHGNLEEDGVGDGRVVSVVKPTPAPKSWKRTQPSVEGDASCEAVGEERGGLEEEVEDMYCVPPDTSVTPEPSPCLVVEEAATAIESRQLESAPPIASTNWGMDGEHGGTELSEDQLQKPDAVEDGRASSSSLVRECFAELDKLHLTNSPAHVLINIDQMRNVGEGEEELMNGLGEVEEEKQSHRHSYENQEIVRQTKERDEVVEEYQTEPSVVTDGAGEPNEDLSQYDMQTVRHHGAVPDAQGYCEVERSQTKGQSPSLVEEIFTTIESRSNSMSTEEGRPLQLADNDITNYDMQTVTHPPVITNAQGYSYCDVGLHSPSELTPSSSVHVSSANSAQNSSENPATTATEHSTATAPLPPGYSEIDVLGSQTVADSKEQGGSHRPPETAPKPQRRPNASEPSSGSSSSACLDLATDEQDTSHRPPPVSDGADADNDSLYAQVMDIMKEDAKSVNSVPSPKPRRKKPVPSHGGKVKGKAPRRRPPPPPPVGAIPGNSPPTPSPFDAPPTPLSAPCLRKSSPLTETLPPLPPFSHRPPLLGSPSHHQPHITDDIGSFTTSLPASSLQSASPKLPRRKGPLSSPSHTDPPSPIQKRGIFLRMKSASFKSRKSDNNNSLAPVSPLLTDEVGKKGEQSPKLGWKKIFRRASGSTTTASNEGEVDGGDVGVVGSNGSESRKRRSREDKLPEVPTAAKSRSLPSPARNLRGAASGVHVHPYNGEEDEEEEDDLYSVVNKPQKPQPKAAAVRTDDARSDENDDAASKAYEVIPSVMRARTGSRAKNDVIKKSNSVEHLVQEDDPTFQVDEEEREIGSRSATSSPVLRRRRPDEEDGSSPEHEHELLAVAPSPKPRHVYATVSKKLESGGSSASKGTPPSPLPKPKRGGGCRPNTRSADKGTVSSSQGATAITDIPRLEVFEPPELALSSAPPLVLDDNHSPSLLATDDGKPRDEDTVSLQGIPSSEIAHEETEGGQIYAVINKKSRKKKNKGDSVGTEGVQESGSTLEGSTVTSYSDEENGASVKATKQKPPVKPPRIKPPKPAPYFARPGSPIPALLAAERGSPIPPSPESPSPPIPERIHTGNHQSSEEAAGTGGLGWLTVAGLPPPPDVPPPLPPSTHTIPTITDTERVKNVPVDVEKQRARLSVVGPPSFPPPPPPKDVSSPPPGDHMYETPPALVKTNSVRESPRNRDVKEIVQLPTNKKIDDWTPGYDVVSNPKKNKSAKDPAPKVTSKQPPLTQRSLPEGSDHQLLSPRVNLYKDERAKLSSSTVVPRSPHLYEAVSDEVLESNRSGEVVRPTSIAVPRRSHIYETPSEVHKKLRRKTPKKRPPPTPPTNTTKPDDNVPIIATEPAEENDGQPKVDPYNAISSPVSEIVANPVSYLGPDLAGKRLTVDIQYNVDEEEERESSEPRFLFNKGHSSSFIRVGGQEPSESSVLSPVHSVNTQSSSSFSVYEDDSDADIMYSTEWESSSGEEDEEEEDDEEEGEEGRVIQHKPARAKTFYIAQEILTTERTYIKGLRLIDRDFRSVILSANRAHDKPVVTEDTLKLILGNVGSILTLNSGMLTELEERMKMWDSDPRIGDVILNRAPYFKIYSDFISRFDKALKTLEETTKKNPQFARVLREFEAQPACAQLPLAGYMLEIVQRIPRYKLLLTDYVKHLPENSPDRIPSEKALDIISSVATHVNETIRQMDNFRKVMEVRKKLIGDTGDTLITPYRKLLKEGMLMKFSRKEPQPRMFFLFNDILIYSSSIPPTNTTFKVIKRIPLEGMRMEMLNDPDMRHGFQIISTCKSFRLEASSNEELHQWMAAFDTAIKDHREKVLSRKSIRQQLNPDGDEESERIPLGHLAPPWLPDSAVSMCQLCSVQFTVTRRRHHCRACGQIFCSDCSSYLAPLRYKSDKLGRVCQSCYESINGEAGVGEERTPKRGLSRSTKSQKINLPSVLREMKARDQNAQISGYLLSHATKSRRWKKKWFIVYNLVLYEFEKHEDVTAKSSVALPSYQIDTTRHHDPLVFCLKHPGTGKLYFKTDTEGHRDRWLEVLEKAVKGEIYTQQDQQLSHTPIRAPSPLPDNDTSL